MRNLYFYKNKTILTLIVLLFISISLMFLNVKLDKFKIRNVFFFLTYPVERSVSFIGTFFKNAFSGFARIRELESELAISRERLVKYQEKLLLYSQIVNENERLKFILELKEVLEYDTTYARIVFRDPTFIGDYFVIDKGSLNGLKNNMPVASYDTNGELFLVGKTVEVNLTASKVKALTAKNFYLGVSLQDTGYVGILNGQGEWNQNVIVDYIPIEANAYIGETVITSGESDIFPYGLKVGTIVGIGKSVMEEFFQKLYVRPIYIYSKIKSVFIIHWEPATEANILIESIYEQ